MTKYILTLIFLLSIFHLMSAQQIEDQENKKSFSEKIHFGGGVQLSLGNAYTTIGVSPSVIYDIDENFATGVSITYLYVSDKLYNYKQNVYGAGILALYNPVKALQLNTEFEYLRINNINALDDLDYWVPALYVGVGYTIGNRGAFGVRYDLLWDENKSVYNNALTPYLRFYF